MALSLAGLVLASALASAPALADTGRAQVDVDDQEGSALDKALDRVAELEHRLANLEDRVEAPRQDALPSVSGRGGISIPVSDVVRDAVGLGGPVEVSGTVRGTAVGLGADVLVREGGTIDGDAVSLGGDVVVEPGGQIAGRSLQLGPEEGAELVLAMPGDGGLGDLARSLGRRLAFLLAFISAGTLAISTWPDQVDDISQRLSDRPFWYGMAGAVLTAALGMGAVVLTLTVIGLPIAVLFLVVLGLAWLMGLVAVCRTAGRRLGFAADKGDAIAWLGGAALFAVLVMVPVLGTVIALVIGFPAVGAAVVAGLSRERPAREW